MTRIGRAESIRVLLTRSAGLATAAPIIPLAMPAVSLVLKLPSSAKGLTRKTVFLQRS